MNIRVGIGYDVHRLAAHEDLWIGGILIPHTKGAVGHSDADVLLHAICDAILGALALGDIGSHFPDNDPALKGIDSKILLKQVVAIIEEKKWGIGNIDSTICLQSPKLRNHIDDMRKTIAQVCSIDIDQVSVKATTTEKLGFVGAEEGISAYATVLLTKN